MKKHKQPLWIGILILFGLFVIGYSIAIKTTAPMNKPVTATSPKNILSEIQADLAINSEIRGTTYWSWVDEKDIVLPLQGDEFAIGSVNINGIGQYAKAKDGDLNNFTLSFFQPILTTGDTVFTKNGLVSNRKNTLEKTDEFGSVIGGYEKGDLKCKYNFMEKSDPFGRFFCGFVDLDQYALQKQFTGLFDMKPKLGQQPPMLRIEKIYKDAALGNYAEGSGPGGYTFMAKKKDDKWNIVWKGQEIALCSEMEKQQIPQEIYGECYDP